MIIEAMFPSLSVIIITKNEAHNIQDCLRSVAFADELVVLDSGSTDATQDLARRLGAKVFERNDWAGFGEQKNRALALATGDWVLSLDADERVTPELAREIQSVVAANNQQMLYEMPRLSSFCGTWIKHSGWYPDHVVRLFPRQAACFSADLVHERLVWRADLKRSSLKSNLLHYTYLSAKDYFKKLEVYSLAWAQDRFAHGKTSSVSRAVLSGAFAFFKSYVLRLGILDGKMGLVVCVMQAQAAFGKYFALYDLNRLAGEERTI